MDKLVRRITVVEREGEVIMSAVVYRRGRKRRRTSTWTRPFERMARRVLKAEIAMGAEGLRQHDKSNRKRRDGWLHDAPVNMYQASRRGYNEARKGVPLRVLPKS